MRRGNGTDFRVIFPRRSFEAGFRRPHRRNQEGEKPWGERPVFSGQTGGLNWSR
jgi:hypothetical protein